MGRVRRAATLARRRPGYLAWRLGEEARREGLHVRLAAARAGRGGLAPGRLVPGGAERAAAATAPRAAAFGAWEEAARATRADEGLLSHLELRRERALARQVGLFGQGPVSAGIPPRWNSDLRTGHSWPLGFHRTIDYVNSERRSDVKVAWELSRLRHCVALAQAAAVLDEPRCLRALEDDLHDWRRHNPLGWSVNWVVAMEVALRAVNVVCCDGILLTRPGGYGSRPEVVASLYEHGWFLFRNLEVAELNGNHFLADAVGLVWLGRYFREIGEGDAWYRRGVDMALRAAREHVLPDGLDHEGSLPYHLLVLEMFLLARAVAGADLAAADPVIASMVRATLVCTAPSGEIPDIGDDDGGRVAAFCDAPPRDTRRVLALAGRLLGTPVFDVESWTEDAVWLTGAAPEPCGAAPERPTRLEHGGIVVLGAGGDRVVVDVGPVGFRGRGGHGHIDAMSFVAWLAGRQAVRDSGTGTYTGDHTVRNELRGVEAHTTVVLDGRPYASPGGADRLWSIDGDSPPTVTDVRRNGDEQLLEAVQELPCERGRGRLRRSWRLTRGRLEWVDRISAPRGSRILQVTQLPQGTTVGRGGALGPGLHYRLEAPAAELRGAEAPWSAGYGSLGRAPRAEVRLVSDGDEQMISWSVGAT